VPRKEVQREAGIKSGAGLTDAIGLLRAGGRVKVKGNKPQYVRLV
jgi:hypothetical protein